ncbi:MAG: Endonuclease/exonuclease/phosphatase, partial [Verrucomicrobiales bacterium]|nr:Endonuclease/exonuclease/phosphatase [Verrucomicrobiales bacterium]
IVRNETSQTGVAGATEGAAGSFGGVPGGTAGLLKRFYDMLRLKWLFFPMLALAGSAMAAPPALVRFATYNVSFFRTAPGALVSEMNTPAGTSANHGNIRQVAEALQRIRPDVLLLNEFDYDAAGDAMRLFQENYLSVPQAAGLTALVYPYRYASTSNTGIPSGFDLDNNGLAVSAPGTDAYGNDSFGFGIYPGQYAPAVFSKFPINAAAVRKFQLFKWKDMPNSQLLQTTGTPPLTTYYTVAERDVLRLSSKTHLDVPIDLGGGILAHLLISHPTPPTFDAAENKNGKRNFDEIRLWADYIDPARSGYLKDDSGVPGGLPAGARFVVGGDQNADPNDGDTLSGAARQLTQHPLINATITPGSGANGGGVSFAGGAGQIGNKAFDTAAFSGGLRVDYVLPSKAGFSIFTGAVFWPGPSDPLRSVVGDTDPSDHHMVWMDLRPQISLLEAVEDLKAEWVEAGAGRAAGGAAGPGGPGVRLTWRAAAGYSYKVQQSPTMAAGTWADSGVVPVVEPGTLLASAVVPAGGPGEGRMFYRLEVGFAP